MRRQITSPLKCVGDAAKTLVDGDLSIPDYHHENNDEIGDLSDAFNKMKKIQNCYPKHSRQQQRFNTFS